MSSGPRANWWDNAYRAWLVSAANGTKVAPRAHFDHNRAVFLEQGEFCSGIAVERQLLGACCRAQGAGVFFYVTGVFFCVTGVLRWFQSDCDTGIFVHVAATRTCSSA